MDFLVQKSIGVVTHNIRNAKTLQLLDYRETSNFWGTHTTIQGFILI